MIFVNSMSDLFHVDVPEDFLLEIFRTMLRVDRHIYQVLTKRPHRAVRFFDQHPELLREGVLPDHIWIGTSVEDQDAVFRVRHLKKVPAMVRFLSCEPLLGAMDVDLEGIHWVIVGGESGIGYRRMQKEWAVSIQRQCAAAGVPFFFKQVGGRTPKAGGRLLADRTWDEYPTMVDQRRIADCAAD
jgi:protein gp37